MNANVKKVFFNVFRESSDIRICAYECSLDLSLLTKWLVFLQNASGTL